MVTGIVVKFPPPDDESVPPPPADPEVVFNTQSALTLVAGAHVARRLFSILVAAVVASTFLVAMVPAYAVLHAARAFDTARAQFVPAIAAVPFI